MDPVIVMVGRENETVYDVELMPDIPAADLSNAIAQAFGWQGVYEIEVGGRRLSPEQTLADAFAWDGAHLTFFPSAQPGPSQELSFHAVPSKSIGSRPLHQTTGDVTPPTPSLRGLRVPLESPQDMPTPTPLKAWKSIEMDENMLSTPAPSSPVVNWKFTGPIDKKKDKQAPGSETLSDPE